jgi:hypothetical protein
MKRILFFTIAIAFGTFMTAQNTAVLKLNPEKNKVYHLRSVSDQTVSQTVNGNQQTVDSHVEYAISLKMIDVTPDFMITEIRFDTVSTSTNTMGKTVSFSSVSEGDIRSSEVADIMSYIMNKLSKNSLYVKVDFTGKPLEIVNAQILSGLVAKDTSAITLTGPTAAAIKTQIAGTVSSDNLKNMIGTFTWCLPGRQVAAGEGWTVTQEMNASGMLLDIITNYRLDAIDGNNAMITAESQVKASVHAAPIQSGGATVTYDNLKGMGKSDMIIDIRTGLTVENNAQTRISGNLGVSGPGFSMDIPLDINGKTKVTTLQ